MKKISSLLSIEYINTLIDMQNENLSTCRKRKKRKEKSITT